MLNRLKECFRDKFYDKVEVGGSFTFYDEDQVGDVYHITTMTEEEITYKKTWYGYVLHTETVSRLRFKHMVSGGDYHGTDYLYALRW